MKEYWEYMENIIQNTDMSAISFRNLNFIELFFSHKGKDTAKLICKNVLMWKVENDMDFNEGFPYFILDVWCKKLDEKECFMLNVVGSDMCIDILCKDYELKIIS